MRRGERSVRQEESVGNRGNIEEMERGGSKSCRCQVAGAKREWKGRGGQHWTTGVLKAQKRPGPRPAPGMIPKVSQ